MKAGKLREGEQPEHMTADYSLMAAQLATPSAPSNKTGEDESRYFEIICGNTVIGCTMTDGRDDFEHLIHAADEDNVTALGEITKEQFDSFGDADWGKPKGTRMNFEIKRVMILRAARQQTQST
jgi:hypothetical protein